MPHFAIHTNVNKDYKAVYEGFDRQLFDELKPVFPRLRVLEFDGQRVDGRVTVELDFLLAKFIWGVKIVSISESLEEIEFVDEGVDLPWFLKYWKHRHIIKHTGISTTIVDDITYYTPNKFLDWIFYPIFKLQFTMRSPIYERYFA
ncbi:MAG: hypothetical protein EAZ57_10230 [Cytophagales bacterium]|nr:MAG: hypothetical protein EAZ67_06020 [Cytophagales bacterium]TAF59710.1 MAG: hypothetical protein EAZ57_10230 [Cytophagales bacterium]